MILQSLSEYYHRLRAEPDPEIAPPGFAPQKISFALELSKEGQLLQIRDIRNTSGKKPLPVELIVPLAQIRSSGIAANFLWDNTGYVLGIDSKGNQEKSRQKLEAFKQKQIEIGANCTDESMQAILLFLKNWNPTATARWPNYADIVDKNVVFMLQNSKKFIHDRSTLKKLWLKAWKTSLSAEKGYCLISGEYLPIARLHNKISGVKNAQSSGAVIVGFTPPAFKSRNKEDSFNAPVSEEATFAYTTALNYLLHYRSKQKIQIGDASTVFWAEHKCPAEDFLGMILSPGESDEDAAARLKEYLVAVRAGKKPHEAPEGSIKFYILGLSPNNARIAIRFWYVNTLDVLNKNLGLHFQQLKIIKEFPEQIEFPGIWRLLIETVRKYKPKGWVDGEINSHLAGAFMRSLLNGSPYPLALFMALMTRIHADGILNYYRAALIKAVLLRNFKHKELSMALNEEIQEPAYRLGRLFAVLEKIQTHTNRRINATIKDRFFGSASITPRIVFPQLLRLSQHHLNKLNAGSKVYFERLIQEILESIAAEQGFPAFLKLEAQGLFALGYYHQRQALFTKKQEEIINEAAEVIED